MRKKVFGRKFKRDRNERQALFKSLISALILNDRIQTTEEKAKAIRPQVEKLVTKALKSGDNAVVHIQKQLAGKTLEKFINDVAPRFQNRNGGYTRIIKTGSRKSDGASLAIIEWTEVSIPVSSDKKAVVKKPIKTISKKTTTVKKTVKKVTKNTKTKNEK